MHDAIYHHPTIWSAPYHAPPWQIPHYPLFNVKLTQQQILDAHGKSPEK